MSRVVITTFGSLGDLHPYVAIALELKRRGHEAILATGECYREYVESRGLGFRCVRPDCDWLNETEATRLFQAPAVRLVPLLVIPHSWDQPDNADRVVRLGIGRALWPRQYTPDRAARELRRLLSSTAYSQRAASVADAMCAEQGAATACDGHRTAV